MTRRNQRESMESSPDLPTAIAQELNDLAHARTAPEREALELAHLIGLSGDRSSIQPLIEHASSQLSESEAAAVEILLGSGSAEWEANFTGRQRKAARALDISYDTFRRRRNGGPSRYDILLERLAKVVAEQTSDQDPDSRWGSSLRFVVAGLAAICLIAVGVAVVARAIQGSDESEPRIAAEETANIVPATEIPVGSSAQPQLDSSAAQVTSDRACRATSATGMEAATLATEAIAKALEDAADPRCFEIPIAEQRGDVFWLELRSESHSGGGAIAIPTEPGRFEVVVLDVGPWQSYKRVGGGNGERSVTQAGLPTGEIVPDQRGFSMVVDGNAYLYGESPSSTFYWMPIIGQEAWLESGGSDGPLGRPTSSVYLADPSFRVDFENGFLAQLVDGSVRSYDIAEDPFQLADSGSLAGQLITARDGTSWFIDDDAKRWWIPDAATWFCAGGEENRALDRVPGYAIHELGYGGVANCPLTETGSNPVSGTPEALQYCRVLYGPHTTVQESSTGWLCGASSDAIAVDVGTVCEWQFGRPMLTIEAAAGWRCLPT